MHRWFVVLAACGAPPVPPAQPLPIACPHATLELAARRFPNVDADDPAAGKSTPWTIALALDANLRGTVEMMGDGLAWSFTAVGKRDRDCHVEVDFDTHEPIHLELDLLTHRGTIRSIDDSWTIP